MDLSEFLVELQDRVAGEYADRLTNSPESFPQEELVFAEIVMNHMSDFDIIGEPEICDYTGKVGNANIRLVGYAVSDDLETIDLVVSLHSGSRELSQVARSEIDTAANQCFQFLKGCVEGSLVRKIDETHDAFQIATTIQNCYADLERIRIFIVTDRQWASTNKAFKPKTAVGKTISIEVMDIERLYRHWAGGKPRDELVVDFAKSCGSPLPCVYVPGTMSNYDYALTAVPAEVLYALYENFGSRLLEANVRSFLSTTGKVNRGMRETLRGAPEDFMAFNNGIVMIADEASVGRSADGSVGLVSLRGMQIVNGGQTTASIFFTKKRNPETNLERVRVAAKIIVLNSVESNLEEQMIADISRYANSQNSVKQSDLSANKPFHVQFEKLAATTYCPDGKSQWFYERAAGSYNVKLAREGTTPARLRAIREAIPSSRKIAKTDLAKYLVAWDLKPDQVSLGAQKNFIKLMDDISEGTSSIPAELTPDWFKEAIAKAIVFKAAQKVSRSKQFLQAQANIAAYLVAIIADHYSQKFDFDRVWKRQSISAPLQEQLEIWAKEVETALRRSSGARMISEYAKKPECWEEVKSINFSTPTSIIPEIIS